MKALWRRLFGRKDELDDATTAYIEGRASPAEVDAVRRELDVSPERGREIEELRQTVDLMRSIEAPPAPRSFALTPDMVPEQRQSFRLDLSYAPAAAAAVLILAVGALIAGDLTDVLRQSDLSVAELLWAQSEFDESERVVQGQSDTVTVVETVVVEKQVTAVERVVETVVVEKPVARTEKVVETVVVEKHVTRIEKVVETVVVEKPVTRTEKIVETVVVEKVVEAVVVEKPVTKTETVVETVTVEKLTAMRAVQESDEATVKEKTPADGTPVSEVAVAGKSEAAEAEQASPTPTAASATLATSVPTVEPTAQPTATPTAEPTAQPTATPVPTIEPTTQPTATPTAEPTAQPTATIEPTAEPTTTPVPIVEPTPRPIPTPILQEDEATRVVAEQDDHRGVKLPLSGISLPLWQLEVLFAVLAGLMVALWAVLRQRSGRRN